MRQMPQEVRKQMRKYLQDDNGATAIEYGLIAAATGLALIATTPLITSNMGDTYQEILDYFNSV